MKRSRPLLRANPAESKTTVKLLRKRKCKACKESFRPLRPLQCACSPACALEIGRDKAAKSEARADRAKREALKTRSDWLKEAQVAFNRYVRLRDAGRPCICCGRDLRNDGPGGGVDAGHYRSVGSAPHLRFHEDNCHAQSKQCNRFGAGRAVDYRLGLVDRIGIARVEALEADNLPRKYDIEGLKHIRDTYRLKAKELQKGGP